MAQSVLRERAGKNGDAVNCGDAVNGVPARVALRAPIDLITQQVRHRYPEEASQNKQIREHGQKQPAGFVAKKRRFQQGLGREQTKNSQCANGQKFFNESNDQHITNRQPDQERAAKAGKFAHFHGREQPERPNQNHSQKDNAGDTRSRQTFQPRLGRGRLYESRQANQDEQGTRNDARDLQIYVVDHAAMVVACAVATDVPYKLNPVARSIRTSTNVPARSSALSNKTILLVRVRPIRRDGLVLLGPSQRTSSVRSTRPSLIRRAQLFTTSSKS